MAEWKNLCKTKIVANYNVGASLDFGCGFYLSPKQKDTEKYALDTVKYNGRDELDDNIPVVIEFDYVPYDDIHDECDFKYFSNYDDEFAEFVFECRKNCMEERVHGFAITGGVMTDAIPTKLMQEYFSGLRSKESVIEEFKKGTSRKQLCLHTQDLCDKLKLSKAYIVNGKELDVNEYGQN